MKKKQFIIFSIIVVLAGLYFPIKGFLNNSEQKLLWLKQWKDFIHIRQAIVIYADKYESCPESMQTLINMGYLVQESSERPPEGVYALYNPSTDYTITSPSDPVDENQFKMISLKSGVQYKILSWERNDNRPDKWLKYENKALYFELKERGLIPK